MSHSTTRPDAGAPPSADKSGTSQLRTIIESLADGIVIVDRAGMIRFANPAAANLFTRSPEALVGTPLGTPLVAGETTEMEIVRRGGGEVVYAELRVEELEWEGEFGKLVSLRDVTDRKYAEERSKQLTHEREARLAAEGASRAKSDFVAIMSHELRTPLNAILGYSELIELGISGDLNDKMRDQIGRIRRSAKHLLGLVNDILDLAKVEAGRLSVASTPATISEAISAAVTLIQPQAAERNLSLELVAGAESLPKYIGDDERVRQILVNLLSNAVKCTEPGGRITLDAAVAGTATAGARLQPRRQHLRVTVSDTGSGIPPDKLHAIFEPFVQAESGPTRSREGSGLGLTIGQRLARAMGGDLTVESTLGKGSSFTLWLPADAAAADRATERLLNASKTESAGDTAPPLGTPRPLVGLSEVADGLLRNLPALVDAIAGRIRCDPLLSMAAGLRMSQVTDHLPSLLADVASALVVIEEAAGEPSALLSDGVEIQRLVSERHGAQRARLGWTEAAMRREFMIIREEVDRVVQKSVPVAGPLQESDAVATVNRFLDQAEYLGVRSLERARES